MKINFNNKFIRRTGIICGTGIVCLYILFLILPFFVSPYVDNCSGQIDDIIKTSTGLDSKIEGLGVVTTPKLGVGIKFKNFTLNIPNSKVKIIDLKDGEADLRLLPLIIKHVEFGNIKADKVTGNIQLTNNGEFEIQKYLEQFENKNSQPMTSLPYGLKLSNHLPNIKVNNYKLVLIDTNDKTYYISGKNLKISDFIFNKKVKVSTQGKIVFDNRTVSNYDIKIFNKIMPQIQFDDFVFPQKVATSNTAGATSQSKNNIEFNVSNILNSVNKTKITADLNTDIKTSGTFKDPKQIGKFEVTNLSVNNLPQGHVKLLFRGKKTKIDSILYTSNDKNEQTSIQGYIKSGRRAAIDMAVKSNAKFENVIRTFDYLAQSFGREDLKTVSATGGINADFKIKSNMKKVRSDGSLKILPSSVKFGAYNVLIDRISADIDLNNNNINIKNAGFSIMGHPLQLKGSISSKAIADLKLTADKLSLKGLLASLGQMSLLKENSINSGTVSLRMIVKGKLKDIKPDIIVNADNLNIYNNDANIRLLLNNALVKVLLNKDKISGNIDINSLKLKNPTASVSVPKMNILADTKNINISNSYVLINNSRVDVKGSVKDYLSDKLNMNITASGNLAAADIRAFIPQNMRSFFAFHGAMPLNVKASGNSKMQNIAFNLKATPTEYVRFLDIKALKGRNTKIHADMKISDGVLTFENSGVYAGNSNKIGALTGTIKNFSNPQMDLNISVPRNISFPIPGIGGISNITGNGNVNITGGLTDYRVKGKVYAKDVSSKNLDFALVNLVANLNGKGLNGSATADKIMMGTIVGTNIGTKFNLNNSFTTFNLSDISADAYNGKVSGKLTYDIPHFAFGLDLTGKNLNSMNAIEAASGISKALTGDLEFKANLTGNGVTDTQILKSLKGNVNFNIGNGRFVSIGKFENFVRAQNIESISILKSVISSLSTATAIQQTDKFKSIMGNFRMSQGEAIFDKIEVTGPMMSYYVKGYYNLLSAYASMTILGRLDSKVVSLLGPFGQLTASKLLSYIPKFGTNTAAMLNKLTQNPNSENTKLIPNLSSGSKEYKDFKVVFIGNIYKASSLRSFRWLSTCDTTQMNVKQDVKSAVQAAKDNVNNQINATKTTVKNVKTNVNRIVNTQKQKVEDEKQAIEQTKQNVQNMKQNAGQSAINLGKLLKNAASKANQQMVPSNTNTPQTNE